MATGVSPVSALVLEDCVRGLMAHHVIEFGHKDLGQGITLFKVGADIEGVGSELTYLLDCKSGETLMVHTQTYLDPDSRLAADLRDEGRREFDVRSLVKVELERIAKDEARYSFDDVARSMQALGAEANLYTDTKEACVCAALYSEFVGEKDPFQENG
mgnify:CR=1 FL=1